MRILVCGGRDFGLVEAERKFIKQTLASILLPKPYGDEENWTWLGPSDLWIIAGGQTGVDTVAVDWVIGASIHFQEFKVNHKLDGPWPGAGPRRNARMLAEGKPHALIAFPGGRGTANMCRQAQQAGVPFVTVVGMSRPNG